MRRSTFAPIALIVAALVALAGFGMRAGAQEMPATPGTGVGVEGELARHPAHIHAGSCPDVGDVVFPLNDLVATQATASPTASPAVESLALASTPAATPFATGEVVAESTTVVEASLDDILSEERAINVHLSPELIQEYIACGDLTGTPTDGELVVQLQELNDSGFVGEAHLVDNGDGTTTVTARLMIAPAGTPEATPAG